MGKATSSMNAVKWGFSSRQAVITGESQAEFDEHRARLFASLQPASGAEEMCVERIADASWRLKRCSAIEGQLFFKGLCEEQGEREVDAFNYQEWRESYNEEERAEKDTREELSGLAQQP